MGNTSSFLTCLFVGWKAKAVFCQTARAGLKHLSSLGEAGVSCGLESSGESHLLLVLSQRCLLFCRRPDFHPSFSRYWSNNCASRTTSGHGWAVLPHSLVHDATVPVPVSGAQPGSKYTPKWTVSFPCVFTVVWTHSHWLPVELRSEMGLRPASSWGLKTDWRAVELDEW